MKLSKRLCLVKYFIGYLSYSTLAINFQLRRISIYIFSLIKQMGGWYRSELREISKVVVQSQSLAKISTYQFMANVTVAGSNVRLIARIFVFEGYHQK